MLREGGGNRVLRGREGGFEGKVLSVGCQGDIQWGDLKSVCCKGFPGNRGILYETTSVQL